MLSGGDVCKNLECGYASTFFDVNPAATSVAKRRPYLARLKISSISEPRYVQEYQPAAPAYHISQTVISIFFLFAQKRLSTEYIAIQKALEVISKTGW